MGSGNDLFIGDSRGTAMGISSRFAEHLVVVSLRKWRLKAEAVDAGLGFVA